MASVTRTIAQSGPVGWNTGTRLWTLSDLISFIPGPTTRLSITSTQPFIVPSHTGVSNPSGALRVGFSVDTKNAPTGGWRGQNYFSLTITLDDGFGVAQTTLTTFLAIVTTPRIVNRIPDQTLPASSSAVQIGDLDSVFATARYGTNPTRAYTAPSVTGGITANISSAGVLTLSTPAAMGSGRVTIRCTVTSESGAPASLTAYAEMTFFVTVVGPTAAGVINTGIPTFYMRQGEERTYDLTPYLTGTEPRVDTASVEEHASITALPRGAGVLIAASAPTADDGNGNRVAANIQSNTVTLSVVGDTGASVSTTFTVEVLSASVLFDFGTPFLSVSSSRLLTINAPGKQRVPTTPYAGYKESFQVEAANDDTAIFTRTSTLPATIQLPVGGEWRVRGHMFLDGFSSLNTREASINAPLEVRGDITLTAGSNIVVSFNYPNIAISDVTDIAVRLYGADLEEFTEFTPTQVSISAPVRPVLISLTPGAPGDYQVIVDAKVKGVPVSHRETIVFGSASTAKASAMKLLVGDTDYTSSLLTLRMNGGVTRFSAVPVLRSNYATITLESDDPLTDFDGKQIVILLGARRIATLWSRSSSETVSDRRRVILEAHGVLSERGPAAVREAGRELTQYEILAELAEQAGVRIVNYSDGEDVPPHKHTDQLLDAMSDLERYGGFMYEDRFGRLALGPDRFTPYDLVSTGIDGPRAIAVNTISRPRGPARFNAIDSPAQTIDADPVEVITTDTDGDSSSLEFTLFAGFDISEYQPDATTHTMKRTATNAVITPPLAGLKLRGEHYRSYTGADRLTYTTEPMQLPRNIGQFDLPRYVVDKDVLQDRAEEILGASEAEDRESVRVLAPVGTDRFDAASYLQVGSLVRYRNANRRIDELSWDIQPSFAVVDLVLSPRLGSIGRYLQYDMNETYDSDKVWA